jgi:hypothetical protein
MDFGEMKNVTLLSDNSGRGFWVEFTLDDTKYRSKSMLKTQPSNEMLEHLLAFHDDLFAEYRPAPVNPVVPVN